MAKLNEIPYSDLEEQGKCGSGTFSQVYRAYWKPGKRVVALKKFLRLQVSEEAEVLSQLSHRNIVKFIGVVTDARICGIVTEYIENGSLYDFLHHNGNAEVNHNGQSENDAQASRQATVEEVDFNLLVTMASDIACGMNYLHSEAPVQVIHHDLKSKNVLLTLNRRCKICDFGSAQLGAATSKSSLAGTYAWMAPEVMKNEDISEKCDVWSFGVVVWELTTREVPFAKLRGEQILWNVAYRSERLPIGMNCPADLAELMRACWKEQESRPTFSSIQSRLTEMAGNAQLVASANTFMADRAAFARENEAFRLRLLAFERELQDRNSELAVRAERIRLRENELEQQFKVPKLEEYDVNMWRDIDVYEWIKHLRMDAMQSGFLPMDQLATYANLFLQHNITGDQLLAITLSELDRIGVKSLGHQKAIRDRITALGRENRLNQHFPTLAATTVNLSLPSPLGAALFSDRVASRQYTRLKFIFGMHLAECYADQRSSQNQNHSHGDAPDASPGHDATSESVGYKFKLFADVLEDEREPSVAAPMFLIRRIEFRYDPSSNRLPPNANGPRLATGGTVWNVDRPPYITPDWISLNMPPAVDGATTATTSANPNSSAVNASNRNTDEIVFPDEHVSIRIEFWPKYVRQPSKVEHRHAFVFERARVRCTSHDLEAAARERSASFKHRRKSGISNSTSVATTGAQQTVQSPNTTHLQSAVSSSGSLSQPFQSQRKSIKNRLMPNYSEMTVTLELQQNVRNAGGDFAAEVHREQALEAQGESEPQSRHSSRADIFDTVLDTVCTTTGTIYSCASPMGSTRMSTPSNTSREHPAAALAGYYSPLAASASGFFVSDELLPYEKSTYASVTARNPRPTGRGAPPQLSAISNSRSKANLTRSLYTPSANAATSSSSSSTPFDKPSPAPSPGIASSASANNWARITARTNTNTNPIGMPTSAYHAMQSPSTHSPQNGANGNYSNSSTNAARLSIIAPATNASREGLSLDLSSSLNPTGAYAANSPAYRKPVLPVRSQTPGGSQLTAPNSGASLLRPASLAYPNETDSVQRAEMMLQQGYYRSSMSNDGALNGQWSSGNSTGSNQVAQVSARQLLPLLSPARESEQSLNLPLQNVAATQTDDYPPTADYVIKPKTSTCDMSTQTAEELPSIACGPTRHVPLLQRTDSSSSAPQDTRYCGSRRSRGRRNFTGAGGSSLQISMNVKASAPLNADQSQYQQAAESVLDTISNSLVQALDDARGDLGASLTSTTSASSRKSTTSESTTTTTSETLTQPSVSGNDDEADLEGFESAASTLSVETAFDRAADASRSRDSLDGAELLSMQLESVRLTGEQDSDNPNGVSGPRLRPPLLSLNDRSQSDMTSLRKMPKASRRRRGKKDKATALSSRTEADVGSGSEQSVNTVRELPNTADWCTVSRKTRPRMNAHAQSRDNVSSSHEHLKNVASSQSLADTTTSRSPLRPSRVAPSSNAQHSHVNAPKDIIVSNEQRLVSRDVPSTPTSPTPADVPPGLAGATGPFRNIKPRSRYSSQSERESVVAATTTQGDKDHDHSSFVGPPWGSRH